MTAPMRSRAMSSYFDGYWSLEPSTNQGQTEKTKEKLNKLLSGFEETVMELMQLAHEFTDFSSKYDVSGPDPFLYVFTRQPNKYTIQVEVFALVHAPSTGRLMEELIYHPMFEGIIERYTNERHKPNSVLQETRQSSVCYQLIVKFEAVPLNKARYPEAHHLLREFQALQHLWESYWRELSTRKCSTDQMIGFPMPFEFKNVIGSEKFDFPRMTLEEYRYYNLAGKSEKLCMTLVSKVGVGTDTKSMMSSFSYMSVEKLGPQLPYLMDLMKSQGRRFSLSSALKIYDQLISRLMIMHKYGMSHCDITPMSLNFGFREASNVVYISSFDSAVLCDAHNSPLPLFHDRFVSFMQVKEKKTHFLHDLESAFYVFIYLLLDHLPWDSRLSASDPKDASTANERTNKSRTIELKEKFWNSSEGFRWVTNAVAHEYNEELYKNFSLDVLDSLYSRMKDSMANCLMMPQAAFFKEIFITGTAPYNCYFGIRRVIASYFRFENLHQAMKDTTCVSKLHMLYKEDPVDKRVAWDLSSWCWNYLDPDQDKGKRRSQPGNT